MSDSETFTQADRAYEWTVRALYAALIVGNLVLFWDSYKGTASGMELRSRVRARWDRLQDCEGCARRKDWINRQVGRVLWEATEVVEQARAEAEGSASE